MRSSCGGIDRPEGGVGSGPAGAVVGCNVRSPPKSAIIAGAAKVEAHGKVYDLDPTDIRAMPLVRWITAGPEIRPSTYFEADGVARLTGKNCLSSVRCLAARQRETGKQSQIHLSSPHGRHTTPH